MNNRWILHGRAVIAITAAAHTINQAELFIQTQLNTAKHLRRTLKEKNNELLQTDNVIKVEPLN